MSSLYEIYKLTNYRVGFIIVIPLLYIIIVIISLVIATLLHAWPIGLSASNEMAFKMLLLIKTRCGLFRFILIKLMKCFSAVYTNEHTFAYVLRLSMIPRLTERISQTNCGSCKC